MLDPFVVKTNGKIYSLSGNLTPIKDLNGQNIKVYSWLETSYGQPAGILGINCGHSRYAFVPNFSIFRREGIPQKENDVKYENTQKQRLLERNIRETKREINLLEKVKINTKDQEQKLKAQQKAIREFTSKNDLVRRPDKEKVF